MIYIVKITKRGSVGRWWNDYYYRVEAKLKVVDRGSYYEVLEHIDDMGEVIEPLGGKIDKDCCEIWDDSHFDNLKKEMDKIGVEYFVDICDGKFRLRIDYIFDVYFDDGLFFLEINKPIGLYTESEIINIIKGHIKLKNE